MQLGVISLYRCDTIDVDSRPTGESAKFLELDELLCVRVGIFMVVLGYALRRDKQAKHIQSDDESLWMIRVNNKESKFNYRKKKVEHKKKVYPLETVE